MPQPITEKKCHKSGIVKPVSEFYKSSSSKDGYAPSCKNCQWGRPCVDGAVPELKGVKQLTMPSPPPRAGKRLASLSITPESIKRADKEWARAKALTAEEVPQIKGNDITKVYRVPTVEEHWAKGIRFADTAKESWEKAYRSNSYNRCAICHQYFQPGEEYCNVNENRSGLTPSYRHVKCPPKGARK